jgi:hypothetical protein
MGVRPVTRSADGRHLMRVKHHRRINGANYPVTVGPDEEFFGTPYDPSDIPVFVPRTVEVPPPTPAAAPVAAPVPQPRTCRSEQVKVPEANGTGEREITIVRC